MRDNMQGGQNAVCPPSNIRVGTLLVACPELVEGPTLLSSFGGVCGETEKSAKTSAGAGHRIDRPVLVECSMRVIYEQPPPSPPQALPPSELEPAPPYIPKSICPSTIVGVVFFLVSFLLSSNASAFRNAAISLAEYTRASGKTAPHDSHFG